MKERPKRFLRLFSLLVVVIAIAAGSAFCQEAADETEAADRTPGPRTSLLHFVRSGGPVGYLIIALSLAGVALVIDAFTHLKNEKLLPPAVSQQSEQLARKGKFSEVLTLCQANDSMLSRIIRSALAQGQLGIEAVRESMQESGTREVTRLQQRVGYIGFIAAVAPMLGLLGTVTGMIASFQVLGAYKGAARPDQLAEGISEALVTTCMGLVVAVPLMFFHNYFRDRVTRISQAASGQCERLVRVMTAVVEARSTAHGAAARREAGSDPRDA